MFNLFRMINFLRKQNIVIYITIFYSLISSIWLVVYFLKEILNISDVVFFEPPSINKDKVVGVAIKGLIAAPLIETLIFQKLIYFLFSKIPYFSNRITLICIVSGMLFGSTHFYSLYHIIATSLIGFILMYAYLIHINNLKKGFWLVAVIHFLINFSALLKDMLFN